MDWFTFIFSSVAFILSLYNFIVERYRNAKRIDVLLDNVYFLITDKTYYFFNISIINKSTIPVVISQININDGMFPVVREKELYCSKKNREGNKIVSYKEYCSQSFPFTVNSYDFIKGMFLVKNSQSQINKNDMLKFEILTSRGKIVKTLEVKNFSSLKEML